jgi:hypothetical protein
VAVAVAVAVAVPVAVPVPVPVPGERIKTSLTLGSGHTPRAHVAPTAPRRPLPAQLRGARAKWAGARPDLAGP